MGSARILENKFFELKSKGYSDGIKKRQDKDHWRIQGEGVLRVLEHPPESYHRQYITTLQRVIFA